MRRMILSVLVVTSLLLLSKAIINATPAQGPMAYLPVVARPLPPTNTPTIPPPTATIAPPTQTPGPPPTNTPLATPVGGNVVCREVAVEVVMCAWVSEANPPTGDFRVTSYGRVSTNSVVGPGGRMEARWYFLQTPNRCTAIAGADGVAGCGFYIGRAAVPGQRVDIDVTMGGFTLRTWITVR